MSRSKKILVEKQTNLYSIQLNEYASWTVDYFLSQNIKNDDLNRLLDPNWVNKIVAGQIEYYKIHQKFWFPDAFLMYYLDDDIVLFDGQHRRNALEILSKMEDYKSIKEHKIGFIINEVKDRNHVRQIFNMANEKLSGNSSAYMDFSADYETKPKEIQSNDVRDEVKFKNKVSEIIEKMTKRYGDIFHTDIGKKTIIVPKIDREMFIISLRSSNIKELTTDSIYNTIVIKNDECKQYMINSADETMKKRCSKVQKSKIDFYMAYYHFYLKEKEGISSNAYTNCKWLKLIFP